jgi:hypothetical protein
MALRAITKRIGVVAAATAVLAATGQLAAGGTTGL